MISTISKVFFVLCIAYASAARLPNYIKKCKLADPSFGDCVFGQFDTFAAHMKAPIKELHLPTLSPFHLEEISVQVTPQFNIKLESIDVYNLDQAKFLSHEVNFGQNKAILKIHFDSLSLIATYDIDGQIMVMPIKGHGPANITAYNFDLTYEFGFEEISRKGKMYFHLKDTKFDFSMENVHLQLDNLFNGDKAMGDQMNQFLNENSKEVLKEFYPGINKAISMIIDQMFISITNSVPLADLFD